VFEGDQEVPPSSPQVNIQINREKTGPKKRFKSEAQFKQAMVDLFKQHDENESNGIEFGAEFDNFMGEAMRLIGVADGAPKMLPRDIVR
jgi:hypothetical protein